MTNSTYVGPSQVVPSHSRMVSNWCTTRSGNRLDRLRGTMQWIGGGRCTHRLAPIVLRRVEHFAIAGKVDNELLRSVAVLLSNALLRRLRCDGTSRLGFAVFDVVGQRVRAFFGLSER